MSTYHTLCDNQTRPISGSVFFVVDYCTLGGAPSWLVDEDKSCYSFHPASAKRFSSFQDAKACVSDDFNSGRCDIICFEYSNILDKYFSRLRYDCSGRVSSLDYGCFEI